MALAPGSRYPAQTDTDPAYPQGKARNAGTFQDGTGTPLEKDWINDLWGFEQALLDEAGIAPSGTPDEVGASDYLNALKAIAVEQPKRDLLPVLLKLRQLSTETSFTDTDESMGLLRLANGTILAVKSGSNDSKRLTECDDRMDNLGTVASITSLVTDLASSGSARVVAIGTGGNRCCFSTNSGSTWAAGSDLGATPHRIIYNDTHSVFMATYAAGVDVAFDADAASTWTIVSSGLTSGQGGIAHFSNGDTLVCGLDGSSEVEIAVSTDGGASWAPGATVPNPGDYDDSGTIIGDGGATIYHVGRVGTDLRVCSTSAVLGWTLLATLPSSGIPADKPRILLCPDTGVLAILWRTSTATCVRVSRDGGASWSDQIFYRPRNLDSFGIARGQIYSTNNDTMYATDILS